MLDIQNEREVQRIVNQLLLEYNGDNNGGKTLLLVSNRLYTVASSQHVIHIVNPKKVYSYQKDTPEFETALTKMKGEDYFYDSVSHDGDLETQISDRENEPIDRDEIMINEAGASGNKGGGIEEGILNIMDNHADPANELDLARPEQSQSKVNETDLSNMNLNSSRALMN